MMQLMNDEMDIISFLLLQLKMEERKYAVFEVVIINDTADFIGMNYQLISVPYTDGED